MVKKSVLTPVLAGVLGLAVVGSGVGYVVTNKNSDKKDNENKPVKQVAESIDKTLENTKKAINGELDFAYDSNVSVSFGDGFTEASGETIKPVSVSTSTKQKGKNTAADVSLSYDNKGIISVKTVYSRDSKDGFAQIPELSDAYLKVNMDSLKTQLDSQLKSSGVDIDSLISGFKDTDIDFDAETFENSLKEYGDTFKNALPESKDGDKVTGDIDDVSYELTTKTYSLTESDALKAVKAVVEKAKTDENMKKFYDSCLSEVAAVQAQVDSSSTTSSTPTYEELIDSLLSSIDSEMSGASSETVDFDIYYDKDDNFAGFNVSDDEDHYKVIVVDSDDAAAIDMDFASGDEKVTMKGAVKSEDDVANGSYSLKIEEEGKSVADAKMSLNDIKTTEYGFTGSIKTEITSNDSTSPFSAWVELKSNTADADKTDVSYEIGMNDKSYVTVAVTSNKTEASDITIPSGDNIYDATNEEQLNTYLSGIDSNKFMENLKSALGDELYNKLMSSGSSANNYEEYSNLETLDLSKEA